MKKISIIIPCYNSAKYIHRCIDSLLAQTIGLDNLQLIFVDDASVDNTVDILFEYEKKYPDDILIVTCSENGRQGTARNIGMKHATADYIGFADHDDRVDKSMYEKLYKKAIEFDCDMVACNWIGVFNENEEIKSNKGEDKLIEINNIDDRKNLLHKGVGMGGFWSRIYKKKLIFDNQVFFPEKLVYDDNYFSFVINFHVKRIYYLNEDLYHYFLNHVSAVREKNAKFHFDRLVIEQMIIKYCRDNELFDVYKDELEINFIRRFYINSINIFFTRFDKVSHEIISKMRDILNQIFPLYEENKYLHELNEVEQTVLKIAKTKLNKEDLEEIIQLYKEMVDV